VCCFIFELFAYALLVRKEILLIFLDDFQMSDVRRRMDSSSDGGKKAKGSPTVINKENNLSFLPISLGGGDYGSCKCKRQSRALSPENIIIKNFVLKAVLWFRMYLGHPDPLVTSEDPDPFIIKQKY
jgi:hypothetical protein